MSSSSFSGAGAGKNFFTTLGLGYSIVIALGFLVIFAAVILASYICCRAARNRRRSTEIIRQNRLNANVDNGVILPRIIFVAEDDEDDVETSVVGLGQDVINSYPKFPYSRDREEGVNDSTCSICLCEYRELEMLRMLPECRHYFHLTCVDAWLKLNASCPVCRNSPLPTPLSTPLSEVVPLSQYAGGRRR
ncbi:RING-H2 finger protein ATL67-like [Impatiens glandulifera]|uniref:RING-H2 finger protein ATL67-like n=1 Tax=Impatiens glandulifera TaxID=253017 RepID=UPI001FB0B59E|nr:RING-H2 finger protein ATL67-like [Impatiens glandulifera]